MRVGLNHDGVPDGISQAVVEGLDKGLKYFGVSNIQIIQAAKPLDRTNYCGIYFFVEHETVVYVGQTVNLFTRISPSHAAYKPHYRVAFLHVEKEHLNLVESFYLKRLKPKYNKDKFGKYKPVQLRNAMKELIASELIDTLEGFDWETLVAEQYDPVKEHYDAL